MEYWLSNKIEPILKAENIDDSFNVAQLIEKIAENTLYDLWVKWTSDEDVTWKSENKESFILWLKQNSQENRR